MKIQNLFPYNSAEFVVSHAARARKRGKNSSIPFLGRKNPREALALATDLIKYFPISNDAPFALEKIEKLFTTIRPLTSKVTTVVITQKKYQEFFLKYYQYSKMEVIMLKPWNDAYSSPFVYRGARSGLPLAQSIYTPKQMWEENVVMTVPLFVCGESSIDLPSKNGFIEALFMIDPKTGQEKMARLTLNGKVEHSLIRLGSISEDFKETKVYESSWNIRYSEKL